MNLRRSKQPAAVRARILQAAQEVLARGGATALTFDRVLARTDLSKGGIQYHFRTKQALLDGLFDHLMAEFGALLHAALEAEPAGPQRRIRAYVETVCQAAGSGADSRAVVALLMADPKYQRAHAELVRAFCQPDTVAPDLSLTCRCAADGLWQAQVLGGEPEAQEVDSVRTCLLRLLDAAALQDGARRA